MSRDALIVGINQYQNLPNLTAAAQDAEGIANLLETYGDFRVRRLPEVIKEQRPQIGHQTLVSIQQLESSLVQLLLPKGNHIPEAVFFYFSGHGLQREVGIREGYLATSDTQPATSNSGLSLSWLRRLIKHSPVRQIVIILDCCHSGEFLSLKDDAWQSSDGQSYLFIAASREYEEAYESLSSDYSVLTQAVISGLLPSQSGSGRVTSTDLVATITNQLSNEIQQPLFEQGGSEIVITHSSEKVLPKSENLSLISRLKQYSLNFCPYLGPQPFEEKHAEYYFGRDALIQELLLALQQTNVCALIGASGSGKTSLLRAAVIPQLSKGHSISDSQNWLIRYIDLDAQPLKALATAFTIADQEVDIANQLQQAEDLLRHESTGLINLATAALLKHPTAKKMWLVLDQFEALLMPTTDLKIQQDNAQVIQNLVTALSDPTGPLGIIISLRSDALDGLIPHDELFSLIENHQVVIPPMSYQEMRDVIEKPAEKVGLKIDPYLVHNITLDLTGAPGELALLQSVLYKLWQHRTPTSSNNEGHQLLLESYLKLGRLSKMLTDRATAFYESLPSKEQKVAQRILLSLCDLGEGRLDQCRPVRKSELVNQEFPRDLIERVLQKLVAERLIVSDTPKLATSTQGQAIAAGTWAIHSPNQSDRSLTKHWLIPLAAAEETIELAHKSLVSDWHILRQWLQTNRKTLRQRREIEERAWVWHQRGAPKCSDYLMGQQYLQDVNQYLVAHSHDLSTMAQRFVHLSKRSVNYQQWRTRGTAVLLPLAVIAGMTVSLVRQQFVIPGQTNTASTTTPSATVRGPTNMLSTSSTSIRPQLPQRWGELGTDHLAMTSQILDFKQRYPQSELNQLSVSQLVKFMTPDAIVANSAALTDTISSPMNEADESRKP